MNKIKKVIPLLVAFSPAIAMAADINSILSTIQGIVNTIIPILMLVAFVLFLWGVVKFIFAGGDETKRKDAKNYIIYGLIGLFVMVAVWGIIEVVTNSFGINTGGTINLPNINP
ncbi:hypothetical protein KJ763_00635 [Patescibacteria group bacterium]|nr:hypothetical protein [Patescibacteria group bacterium]